MSNRSYESENAGTRELKSVIKILLDNGYTYKYSVPANFSHPSPKNSVTYKKWPVEAYISWEGDYKNDSGIQLIFEPVTRIPAGISKSLRDLSYNTTISDHINIEMITPGDSLAVFNKQEIGTDIKIITDDNGKKTRMVDINSVKGETIVLVQYDDNFDNQKAEKYYGKSYYGDYVQIKDPSLYERKKPKKQEEALMLAEIKTTKLATTFIQSLVDELDKKQKIYK